MVKKAVGLKRLFLKVLRTHKKRKRDNEKKIALPLLTHKDKLSSVSQHQSKSARNQANIPLIHSKEDKVHSLMKKPVVLKRLFWKC